MVDTLLLLVGATYYGIKSRYYKKSKNIARCDHMQAEILQTTVTKQ